MNEIRWLLKAIPAYTSMIEIVKQIVGWVERFLRNPTKEMLWKHRHEVRTYLEN